MVRLDTEIVRLPCGTTKVEGMENSSLLFVPLFVCIPDGATPQIYRPAMKADTIETLAVGGYTMFLPSFLLGYLS